MTEPVQPTIRINLLDGWRGPPETDLIAAARSALETGRADEAAELSITLLPAASMRALNRDYHGIDDVTDVLAFGLGEDPLLGDIYISPEIAGASARELGLDPGEELLRLVIHGVLHLLGHDHPEGEARYASPMFELQERLLARLLAEFRDPRVAFPVFRGLPEGPDPRTACLRGPAPERACTRIRKSSATS